MWRKPRRLAELMRQVKAAEHFARRWRRENVPSPRSPVSPRALKNRCRTGQIGKGRLCAGVGDPEGTVRDKLSSDGSLGCSPAVPTSQPHLKQAALGPATSNYPG